MGKLYFYGFLLILILIGGWYIFGIIEENGQLTQANSNLKQAVEDGEKERTKLKALAKLNSTTIAKASKAKNALNTYALKLAGELEVLKYENAEIKKWSISVMPYILAGRLLGITDNDDQNGLYISPGGVINTDAGTEIEVQNEALYNYANDLKSALGSCNADKTGFREWYQGAGIILN